MSVSDIIRSVGETPTGTRRPAIPVAGVVQYVPQRCPVDPYVIGALIGDGCLKQAVRFSSGDAFIVEEIGKSLPWGVHIKLARGYNYRIVTARGEPNPVLNAVRSLGLAVGAKDKHIPAIYKYNSVPVRWALLQGLMDTAGSVTKIGGCYFYTISDSLAKDVAELVFSLGGKVRHVIKHPFYRYKGTRLSGQPCHILCIRLLGGSLFRLPRKLERVQEPKRQNNPLMVSFEDAGEASCTCISVEHPDHLFQIQGHVVTHNSALIRAASGVFSNTPGTHYVRDGADHCSVELSFEEEGKTVLWEKGSKIRPRYSLNGGPFLYPGKEVPDGVQNLKVAPITAGGQVLWPQIAHQFVGQVFLLDQPGSVIAETVADVERVGKLSSALKLSESDRRSVASDLKVRRKDLSTLQENVEFYAGVDAVAAEVADIEALWVSAQEIHTTLQDLRRIRDNFQKATDRIQFFSGIDLVDVPTPQEAQKVSSVQTHLGALQGIAVRHGAVQALVGRLQGVDAVAVPGAAVAQEASGAQTRIRALRTTQAQHRAAQSLVASLAGVENINLPEVQGINRMHRGLDALRELQARLKAHQESQRRSESLETTMRDINLEALGQRAQAILKVQAALGVLKTLHESREKILGQIRSGEDFLAEAVSEWTGAVQEVHVLLGSKGECPTCGATIH